MTASSSSRELKMSSATGRIRNGWGGGCAREGEEGGAQLGGKGDRVEVGLFEELLLGVGNMILEELVEGRDRRRRSNEQGRARWRGWGGGPWALGPAPLAGPNVLLEESGYLGEGGAIGVDVPRGRGGSARKGEAYTVRIHHSVHHDAKAVDIGGMGGLVARAQLCQKVRVRAEVGRRTRGANGLGALIEDAVTVLDDMQRPIVIHYGDEGRSGREEYIF